MTGPEWFCVGVLFGYPAAMAIQLAHWNNDLPFRQWWHDMIFPFALMLCSVGFYHMAANP